MLTVKFPVQVERKKQRERNGHNLVLRIGPLLVTSILNTELEFIRKNELTLPLRGSAG